MLAAALRFDESVSVSCHLATLMRFSARLSRDFLFESPHIL
jgi:hypothetical protein